VQGIENNGVRVFTAIPFAAPPVGPLRLRPPQPVTKWTEPLVATRQIPYCVQFGGNRPGQEDCLYLSVWAPATGTGKPLPVMVWSFGGGLRTGGPANFDGSKLARDHGVVVVTMNFRSGLLGMMAAPVLDEPGAKSGNYIIMDQQAALRWVQRNIGEFGGDPKNVTLFGQSSGGGLVLSQVSSPAAKGLIAKAIVESDGGGMLLNRDTVYAKTSPEVIKQLGCTGRPDVAACIREVPVSAFLKVNVNKYEIRPVQDDALLPMDTYDAFTSGKFNRIPVMIGSNIGEGATWVTGMERSLGHPISASEFPAKAKEMFGDKTDMILAEYPVGNYPTPDAEMMNAETDYRMACPVDSARRLLSKFVPTYGFEMSQPNPAQAFPSKDITDLHNVPYHGSELGYIFGNRNGVPLASGATALSNRFEVAWTNFAKFGTPDPSGKEWPRFTVAHPVVMSIEEPPKTSSDFAERHHCAFMEQKGLVIQRLRNGGGEGAD